MINDKLKTFQEIRQTAGIGAAINFFRHRLVQKIRGRINYQNWWQKNRIKPQEIEAARSAIATWQYHPTFSILLPVYNVKPQWLEAAIKSVEQQIYPHWELCIADDNSTLPEIKKIIQQNQAKDKRIKSIFREKNGNISAASNTALTLATGDYIALLDHDDELAINALFEVAKLLQTHPEADFIYTDEDHINLNNKHIEPAFKPAWSPEYFESQMYTCHLGIYRTELIKKIGGFRSEYDGAQDYDLVLRLTEKTQKIYYIPKILYHWRTLKTSSASGLQGKPWAFQQGKKALTAMLERSDDSGTVEEHPKFPGVFRVRRHIKHPFKISIIIPSAGKQISHETGEFCLLEACIESILDQSTYRYLEIIIVDGYDIPEPVLARLESKIKLVRDTNPFNFSHRINLGAAAASGEMLLLLNDDTTVLTPDWLESLLQFAQQPEIGAVGAKLLFPDGKIQHTGIVILDSVHPMHVFYGYDSLHSGYCLSNIVNRNYLAVTGACLMMRNALFQQLGGLDETFPLNYNDVDLCLKAHQAGYRNLVTPYAQLNHYGSASRCHQRVNPAERQKFAQKWAPYLEQLGGDPYYNPNFDQTNPNFEL
ncbi:glycosyltransferase family 2 protein [Spirulina sp. CS-785/01]|uniref:glycosyltransferase family 2 protein n=1 Tax=Spirulina sp. CS-785/01 TaxID=3021716 RepID=UPI00232C15E5|nr:glycosyltransferase family 2 protein [Spirulina sp. CS-785/01]MDB9312035.1 glycosyltransferase family 2 protein [Spirulina sp. CS-785/01]